MAFTEARRALEDQERAVNELRTRSGVLIAAAAITTSFFGGAVIADGDLGASGWVAVSFLFVVGASVLVLIHRDLALHMACSHKQNRGQLRWLLAAFRVGVVLLVLEVIAWVIALIAQGS